VVSTLERRVERLETSFGGSGCERCANTTIVISGARGPSGADISVVKEGNRFPPEAARAFHREEQPGGVCPRCGHIRQHVRVSWGPRT